MPTYSNLQGGRAGAIVRQASRVVIAAIAIGMCAPAYAQEGQDQKGQDQKGQDQKGQTASGQAQTGQEVEALWKPQEINFDYQSFNHFYSCESLESKLEQILRQMGAEAVVRVRSPDCGRGPVRMPRATIQLISPVPATPDAVADIKKNQSERELVARVTGKTAELKEMEKPFPAQWKRVTIGKGRRAPNIERGDCELVDQIRRRILPKLAVRVVEENTPCAPNSPSIMRPTLVVEALTAMPKPDDVVGGDTASDRATRSEDEQ